MSCIQGSFRGRRGAPLTAKILLESISRHLHVVFKIFLRDMPRHMNPVIYIVHVRVHHHYKYMYVYSMGSDMV